MKTGNPYRKQSDILIVSLEDFTGRRFWKSKVNVNDTESVKELFNTIIEKSGLSLRVMTPKDLEAVRFSKYDEQFSI